MKAGQNDPCPSGSGKKYKKCCMGNNIISFPNQPRPHSAPAPSHGEPLALQNSAASLDSDIKENLKNRKFASLDEINEYFTREMDQKNNQGYRDFLGLSPVEIRWPLSGFLDDNRSPVTLNQNLNPNLVSQGKEYKVEHKIPGADDRKRRFSPFYSQSFIRAFPQADQIPTLRSGI